MKNSKRETIKKSFVIPLPRIAFKKRSKGEKFLSRPTISSAQVLIDGKLVVFIFCSLVSAFINLVFISNLTKSDYTIGTLLSIPAAVVLGSLSLGLDLAKFLLAIQVNTLNELVRKLSKFEWVKRVKRAAAWWRSIYIVFILLSVVTSVSLSTISIGAGISRNANTLKQINEFIEQGTKYHTLVNQASDTQFSAIVKKSADNSEEEAIKWMRQQEEEVWPKIQEWQNEYTDFLNAGLDPNDKTVLETPYNGATTYFNYWTTRDRDINNLLASSKYSTSRLTENQIRTLTVQQFTSRIRQNYIATNKVASTDEVNRQMTELKDSTLEEAKAWIDTLNAIGFTKNVQVLDEKGGGSKATISTSQISESKAIVDTCDYIVGIVQTEQQKYNKDDSKKGEYRIVVGKNRNGDTGRSVDFEIDWSYMSLKEKIGERK